MTNFLGISGKTKQMSIFGQNIFCHQIFGGYGTFIHTSTLSSTTDLRKEQPNFYITLKANRFMHFWCNEYFRFWLNIIAVWQFSGRGLGYGEVPSPRLLNLVLARRQGISSAAAAAAWDNQGFVITATVSAQGGIMHWVGARGGGGGGGGGFAALPGNHA